MHKISVSTCVLVCMLTLFGCATTRPAQDITHEENKELTRLSQGPALCMVQAMENMAKQAPPVTHRDVLDLAYMAKAGCEAGVYVVRDYMESIRLNQYAIQGYTESLRDSMVQDAAALYIQKNGLVAPVEGEQQKGVPK